MTFDDIFSIIYVCLVILKVKAALMEGREFLHTIMLRAPVDMFLLCISLYLMCAYINK